MSPQPPKRVFIPQFKSCPAFPVTYLPNGWGVAVLNIDPDLATEMLQRNADNQRKFIETGIERYASDMASGSWLLTHQGIAFNSRGQLHDGQNRLRAVIVSGATVPFLVFFGAGDHPEMTVIDTGKSRSVLDAAKVNDLALTRRAVTTLNAMIRYGMKSGNTILNGLTQTKRLALIERHRPALDAVDEWFGHGKIANRIGHNPVLGAVACAYYHVDRERLARFVSILIESIDPGPNEQAPRMLRQYIQTTDKTPAAELFLKTCRTLQYFVAGQNPARNITAAAANPYPVPDMLADGIA